MKGLFLIIFLLLTTAGCGKNEGTANAAEAPVAPLSLVDKGICNGPPVKECAGAVLRGCAYKNVYSDHSSNELWTSADGTLQYQGFCAYGSTANSCAAGTTCP